MKKIIYKYKGYIRKFPFFGQNRAQEVEFEDSKIYISEFNFEYDLKILEKGNYKYEIKEVWPKWLWLEYKPHSNR